MQRYANLEINYNPSYHKAFFCQVKNGAKGNASLKRGVKSLIQQGCAPKTLSSGLSKILS
jgi:hypothetical protein